MDSKDVDINNEKSDNDKNDVIPNVRKLKIFFQNQNQPIMGLQHINDNTSQLHSLESCHSQREDMKDTNQTNATPVSSSTMREAVVRPNRKIPRPPKAIQCPDMSGSSVSSLCKVLPTIAIPSERPVPKPRKSLQLNSNKRNCDNIPKTSHNMNANSDNSMDSLISDTNQSSNSLTLSTIKELHDLSLNDSKVKSHSIYSVQQNSSSIMTNDNNISGQTSDDRKANNVCEACDETAINCNNNKPQQSSTKSKKAFKSFLKRSKLLSLRKKSTQNNKKNKICVTNSDPSSATQLRPLPVKPTRSPPLPPLLHFRPAAPLPPEPNEDYYEDTLAASNTNNNSSSYNPYELYNDSVESEQIYCSLDNDDESGSEFYSGINDYDDGLAGYKHSYFTDNYYEESIDNLNSDCDRIYEVLPFERDLQTDSDSNASTVSLDEKQADSDGNPLDPLAKKRELKAVKLRKKFNLTGEEIPVNAGIVKEDNRGTRYDLFVRKGETVLILRMEGNPPGKWLAKNERAKVGFVDLANISFDAESVKCIIKTFASHKP